LEIKRFYAQKTDMMLIYKSFLNTTKYVSGYDDAKIVFAQRINKFLVD